jgi:hypothetical protein
MKTRVFSLIHPTSLITTVQILAAKSRIWHSSCTKSGWRWCRKKPKRKMFQVNISQLLLIVCNDCRQQNKQLWAVKNPSPFSSAL